MATLTITIRNSIKVYGNEPITRWGVMVWGRDSWAEMDIVKTVDKFVANSLTVETDQTKRIKHQVLETISVDSSIYKTPKKLISNQITADSARSVRIRKLVSDTLTLTDAYFKRPMKLVSDSLTVDTAHSKKIRHLVSEQVNVGTTISRRFPYRISNTLNVSSAVTVIYRKNNGWYLKKGDTINALNFPNDQFTEVTNTSASWAEIAVPTTTWTNI